MSAGVNFLPWRQMRLRQHLRRWGVLTCGVGALCVALVLALRTHWQAVGRVNDIQRAAVQQISQQLALREQQYQALLRQQERVRQRLARRQETLAWSPRLQEMVARLPAQAWLNALSYRDSALQMSGTLNQFTALAVLEQGLQTLPGFQPGKAGKIQRDSAGRWVFEYHLQKDVAHAAP